MTAANPGPAPTTFDLSDLPFWVRTRDGLAFSDMTAQPGGRAPDFCIIGAAKTATTSINAMLAKNPALFLNPLKEPHYYSTDAYYGHRRDWYFGLHADAKADQLVGEASTSYSRFPAFGRDVPARMAADNPDMKIILNVREPVARLQSECLQEIKYRTHALGETLRIGSLDAFFEHAESSAQNGRVETGQYMDQVEHFLNHFPERNIKVVFYDDFRADPQAFMAELTDFLGVAPVDMDAPVRANITANDMEEVIALSTLRRLDQSLAVRTARRLLPQSLRQMARRIIVGRKTRDLKFSAQMKARFQDHYAPHNDRLRAYTGRSLADWS